MSKSAQAPKTQAAAHPHHDASRMSSLRGALVLLIAGSLLVAGTYYIVLALTGPDGFFSHLTSSASADIDGRTQTLASELN